MKSTVKIIVRTMILALMTGIIIPATLSAQQVLRFKSGYEYRVVIIEKTADSIKYQLIADPSKTLSAPLDQIENIKADPASSLSTQPVQNVPGHVRDYQVHDKAYWEKRVKKYTSFCIAGGAMLAVGGGLTIYNVSNNKEAIDDGKDFRNKWISNFFGVGFMVTGTILMVSGGVNIGVAKKELKNYKIEVSPNPEISGMTIRVKF